MDATALFSQVAQWFDLSNLALLTVGLCLLVLTEEAWQELAHRRRQRGDIRPASARESGNGDRG